ncbi:hypothetical protein ANCDUO_12923 [Ancylostoma duodenale]|uniref:Uncharacterized protein n=1 Tax=Ancylostoma duodenale TaxID=51022 RepID=A0A0C2D476_9BILA|nr:hypothetical protein ANCDUO_12923 [Ancylostoma duodenale]
MGLTTSYLSNRILKTNRLGFLLFLSMPPVKRRFCTT